MNGKVRTLRQDRGFGFLIGDDGKEYFFHSSSCVEIFEDLREHDAVSFEIEPSQKGPRANHVQRVLEPAAKETT